MKDPLLLPLTRRNRTLSFGVKINFILGLGLAILVGVGSLAYRSIEALVDTSRDEGASLVEAGRIEGLIGALRRTQRQGEGTGHHCHAELRTAGAPDQRYP